MDKRFCAGLMAAFFFFAGTVYAHEPVAKDAPEEIRRIIEMKCLTCHASQPSLSWYAKMPGVKQYIRHKQDEAFEHMPFESWLKGDSHLHAEQLEEIAEEVSEGHMPPRSYTFFRPKGKLSKEEQQALLDWIQLEQTSPAGERQST